MKKLISISLCLCLVLIPLNVTAVEPVEAITNITDSSDIIETPIDNGDITITPTPGSPEEQAIQKILAHKKAMGEEIPNETRVFTEDLVDGGIYYIKNYFSGKYLNVHYGVDANGTNVYQWTGDSSTEQKFKVVYHSATDSYKIYAMCSSNGNNRVLDVVRNGSPLASGQNVDIWTPVDHTAQRLILTPLIYDNLFHIHMLGNEDLYFTTIDKSNGTSGGTKPTSAGNVFIQTFDINDNQQWQFIRIADSELADPSSPFISVSITGNKPYYTNNYALSPGSTWYGEFKPTANYDCSIFTSSYIDTYMEIYSDEDFTNLIISNDDGGSGTNALVYLNVTSGSTYYIKIRGYDSSTYGSFKFVLHRGLPTSQSEKEDMISIFNSSSYCIYNTCYTYALGYYINPVTQSVYQGFQAVPGGIDGNYVKKAQLSDSQTAKTAIEAAVLRDCNRFGGDFVEITETAQPRNGYYKVALFLDPEDDYHWYRQLPNGQWAHKLSVTEATDKDFSNNIIYNPKNCNRDYSSVGGRNYSVFLGWYEIKTPAAAISSNLNSIAEETEKNIQTYNNLTTKDTENLQVGMPVDQVVKILGMPHNYCESGAISHIYILSNGTEVEIFYDCGAVSSIIYKPKSSKDISTE